MILTPNKIPMERIFTAPWGLNGWDWLPSYAGTLLPHFPGTAILLTRERIVWKYGQLSEFNEHILQNGSSCAILFL